MRPHSYPFSPSSIAASDASPAEGSSPARAPSHGPPSSSPAARGTPAAPTPPVGAAYFPEVLDRVQQPDVTEYLPDLVQHAARMLESMLAHHETAKRFVERGGLELLLQVKASTSCRQP